MLCHIYRSTRDPGVYLYLADKDDFSRVPEVLLTTFGQPIFSFSFDLISSRKLARENTTTVLQNLGEQGYHLQLPLVQQACPKG